MKTKLCSTLCLAVLHVAALAAEADQASAILRASGVKGGLVVHLGCGGGKLTAALRANDRYLVHGLDTDAANVAKAREHIGSKGLYGRVSVATFAGGRLPYVDSLVNLLVADELGDVPMAEVLRVLRPLGVAMVGGEKTVKPWAKGMDQWTHYLHGPQNNAVANDVAIGAPRSLRWSAPPRWGRTHEELASLSALVSARGRLFYILDDAPLISLWYPAEWKLVARDGFNGKKLWDKAISKWNDHLRHFRSGPLHLPRRLVAVGDDVFVTLGLDAPVTRLDAATGETRHVYKRTEHTEEIVFHDGSLYLMVGTSEGKRSGAGLSARGEPTPTESRFLVALDVESGKELWRKNAKGSDFILPLSLTVLGDKVFYQDIRGIACVDARSGAPKWTTTRPTPSKRYGWSTSTFVVTEEVVLCADRKMTDTKGAKVPAATTDLEWGVTCFNVSGVPRRGANELIAYSADDGRELWSAPCGEGYNSPVDVFVVDGLVWLGRDFNKGYDLKTGEVRRTLARRAQPVGMVHDRCYRNKASSRFIFTGRDGIELIDVTKGWAGNNSWLRGTCQYGILPANGMLYTPPDACGCHPKARLQGFNALSSSVPASAGPEPTPQPVRLVKGPAYGRTKVGASAEDGAWPMYRHDSERSGATSAIVPNALKFGWSSSIGGRLTQPVLAYGKVFVASVDAHTVHALNASDGREVWKYIAGGRIDSSPTLFGGLAIFGSADGWVTCLDQRNGQVVWRYRAAPEERLIANHGQLESTWPVHGSVLLHNDAVVFTAGRSSYLDGGILFTRLDPMTGKVLATSTITHIDWVTGKQTGLERGGSFDSEGTLSDILSADGESIFLKHMCFDGAGRETKSTTPHLFAPTGMLGEEWFVRAYWLYGTDRGAGYFRWADMKSAGASIAPAGRILSFDSEHIYGYGRVVHSGSWTGHRGDKYHLFSSVKAYEAPADADAARRGRRAKKPPRTYLWSHESPSIVRAMVLAGDKLVVAGLPALARKDQKGTGFVNPKDGLEALWGRRGGILSIHSTAEGATVSSIELASPPVFDGMSATPGRILMSLRNGNVVCYVGNER